MERRILGVASSNQNALAKLITVVIVLSTLLILPTPAAAQGGLVACLDVTGSGYAGYFTHEVGTSSSHFSVELVETTVIPYGDGWYGRLSIDLHGLGEDVFGVQAVALYSVSYTTTPETVTNTNAFAFLTPYSNGIAGRDTRHNWVENIINGPKRWIDYYPELPQADSVSVAMFVESGPIISHTLQVSEVCVKPVNAPTTTPQNTATIRPTRTPTITKTPTQTRTSTPQTYTPVPSLTASITHTPNSQTLTATFVGTGTPVPVPGTLESGEWRPYEKPATCGEDELNPCGPLPFPPIAFATVVIASPSGIPTLTPNVQSTAGAGSATPTFSWDAQGTAMATLAQYGGAGGYNIFSAANTLGGSIGFTFGMFNALQSLNLGRIGVLIAFIIMTLLFIVFVRISTFGLRILLFVLKLVRIVP